MTVELKTSQNALIPFTKAVIFTFSQDESIKTFRITNSTNSTVDITIWFDPTGTVAGVQQLVLFDRQLGKKESVLLEGTFDPENGGSFTAEADTDAVVAVVITGVTR